MEKTVKLSMGVGVNKVEFDIPISYVKKVRDIQKWIREKREREKNNQFPDLKGVLKLS